MNSGRGYGDMVRNGKHTVFACASISGVGMKVDVEVDEICSMASARAL